MEQETRMKVFVFKIPREMNEQLGEYADRDERTKAFVVRKALSKFLGERADDTKPD